MCLYFSSLTTCKAAWCNLLAHICMCLYACQYNDNSRKPWHGKLICVHLVHPEIIRLRFICEGCQVTPRVGPGHPLPPLSIYFLIFSPIYFSLSFIGFTYFLLLSIPSLSTIVPLRFQAGGRRRRPNLGLVCVLLCNLCYLYSLVKMYCGVLFYLV